MNKLRWQFSIAKHKVGWFGLIGLVELIFVVVYFFTVALPNQQLLADAQQALVAAKSEQTTGPVKAITDGLNAIEQLQIFTDNFPATESVNKTWEQLAKLADKAGLTINHARYESLPEEYAGLLRYKLYMPVKATYPQIRDFLAEVVQSKPNVALEQLSFRREFVDASLLEANIDLVLYSRAP